MKQLFLAIICAVVLCTAPCVDAATYYVSPTGNDSNAGSIDKPFLTVQKGLNTARSAGDLLYVRAGTYAVGRLDFSNLKGTQVAPITVSGYQGERPVLDASGKIAALWDQFINVGNSSYLTIANMEIKNSRGRGIYMSSSHHVTLRDVWVHDTALAAVWADNISDLTIEDSRFWMNNIVNNTASPWYAANMWMGALVDRGEESSTGAYATNVIIRRNDISQSFGECINLHGRVDGATIEDNTIHDCWAPAIYFPNDQNITIQRNTVYHTNDSRFLRGGNPSAGIGAQKEGSPTRPGDMKNIMIRNNYVKGFTTNLFFWGSMSGYLDTITVSDNTFVDAHSNAGTSFANIYIEPGPHKNAVFTHNTIIQNDASVPIGHSDGSFTFTGNAWSKLPNSNMRSSADTVASGVPSPTPSHAASSVVADANGDGHVDGVDYAIWLSHYNRAATGASNGDFSGDGKVDGVDYVIWVNQYEG